MQDTAFNVLHPHNGRRAIDASPSSTQQSCFPWHGLPLELKQHILQILLDDCKQHDSGSAQMLLKTIRDLASVGHSFGYDVLRQPLLCTLKTLRERRLEVDPCVGQAPGLPPWLELNVDITIDEARRLIWSIETREVRPPSCAATWTCTEGLRQMIRRARMVQTS